MAGVSKTGTLAIALGFAASSPALCLTQAGRCYVPFSKHPYFTMVGIIESRPIPSPWLCFRHAVRHRCGGRS
jgi:hypothetical protein